MEGLSVLEYFHLDPRRSEGAGRHGASATADSGYLTRRLVDVSQDVIIRDAKLQDQGVHRAPDPVPEGLKQEPARADDRGGRPQAARLGQARQDGARREGPRSSRCRCSARYSTGLDDTRAQPSGSFGSEVQERVRVCQACYAIFLVRRDVRGRRTRSDHRCAVDRRAQARS